MTIMGFRAHFIGLLLAGATALSLGLSGCTTNPATGESVFTGFMSPSQEMEIGAEEHPKILAEFGGAYDDPEIARYVVSIGELLHATTETPDRPFTFTIVDSPTVNAFALPGGYVYVTRGLMALANSEAELAGVIAHEIGHVTARHPAQRYSHGMVASLGATLLGILTESPDLGRLGRLAAGLYIQGYSREQEYEADRLGVRYLARAGYDPMAMASFLKALEADDALTQMIAGEKGAEPPLDLFRSHPRTADRIVQAAQAARGQVTRSLALDRDIYLRKIDGLVWGDSPDQGYVKGRVFEHPALRFRFEAPPGFHMTNTDEAVFGEHDNGALFIFDMDAPPSRDLGMMWYLVNVWAEGRRLEKTETLFINGMEAVTGATRITSGGEAFDARLVAIRFSSDQIARFSFLTPPGLSSLLSEDLRRTTYSFRRLSEAEAAASRPLRIRVVEVERGDSVEGFARRMAVDEFPFETFLTLNGLPPGQPLELGRLVKIVAE